MTEALRHLEGIAAPLLRSHVDTDQIIPTRFLARLSEEGLGEGLFAEWARRPDGTPDSAFVLNQPPWDTARLLVAGPAFGCGSSREAAPRALRQRGLQAVVAPSFGDTFFNNCFRNAVVPIRLDGAEVDRLGQWLLAHAAQPAQCRLTVDVAACTLSLGAAGWQWRFELPPRLHRMLLEGLDEIALTLTQQSVIDDFRLHDQHRRPWAYR